MFEKNDAKIHFGSKAAYAPLFVYLAPVENEQRLRQAARAMKKMMARRDVDQQRPSMSSMITPNDNELFRPARNSTGSPIRAPLTS